MPSPDQMMKHEQQQIPHGLAELLRQTQPSLAGEVAALREEIAALRDELKPVSSLILTGQQVVAEFKRLAVVRA